ncbi:GNAT family N-acetyltransferase [Allomesorhizobium camelthorni]|uniref:GNAT family N-acetyltransferase n=1 Tax=Allomesorhizobium camelthorni TaxID=475069 RepID=A0A6G4W9V9_9HYPH|nr:GNAT family protein [Mesorhizobium camelthorni]NGO51562.1 GNAT family N-acetyltransferase [Mesorhizobium camelthorni]
MTSVYIKPVARSDADELIRVNAQSRSYHEPWVQPFTDAEGFETWFDEIVTGANVGLVAREQVSGEVVGVVNVSQIFRKGFQNAYLGFYGSVAFAGRGLMTEAVWLSAHYSFDQIGLHRLEANVQPGNLRSIALVRRVGFRKEGFSPRYLRINGIWCDHERWALLSDELAS